MQINGDVEGFFSMFFIFCQPVSVWVDWSLFFWD